jgi:hypothetical protein
MRYFGFLSIKDNCYSYVIKKIYASKLEITCIRIATLIK